MFPFDVGVEFEKGKVTFNTLVEFLFYPILFLFDELIITMAFRLSDGLDLSVELLYFIYYLLELRVDNHFGYVGSDEFGII